MKKIQVLFILFCLFTYSNIYAQDIQEATNNKIHYKVIFPAIDQYQLKKILPICNDVFKTSGSLKGNKIHELYFITKTSVTTATLKAKLLENNYTFSFTLLVLNPNTQTYEKK